MHHVNLRERERPPNKPCQTLTEDIVEALDVTSLSIALARLLAQQLVIDLLRLLPGHRRGRLRPHRQCTPAPPEGERDGEAVADGVDAGVIDFVGTAVAVKSRELGRGSGINSVVGVMGVSPYA